MQYSMEDLTLRVRVKLGQDTPNRDIKEILFDDNPRLDALIEMLLPEAAMEVECEAPVEMLEDLKKFDPDYIIWLPWQKLSNRRRLRNGRVPLPANFMRLVHFKMRSWERAVYEAERPGSVGDLLQGSRAAALRGTPERPKCVLEPLDDGWWLRFSSSSREEDEVLEGSYLPLPLPDKYGFITLSRRLLPQILDLTAAKVRDAMRDEVFYGE